MKIVFDVLGSPERSGGMRLHATEIVTTWSELYPEDDIVVVGGAWAKVDLAPLGVEVVVLNNERILGRATGQLLVTPWVAVRRRADQVVSLSPIVSPLIGRSRSSCFQHDWRHKKNPREFGVAQRMYRILWQASASYAGVNFCISEKTVAETERFARRPRTRLVENGRDHARRWNLGHRESRDDYVVTFGHHNNKRPELVLAAFAAADGLRGYELVVLGARGAYAAKLASMAATLGVSERLRLPGFVSEAEYQSIISDASAIVLASSDEGFGLPVAEAQFLGVPAVITEDSGVAELFGEYPIIARADPSSLGQAVVEAVDSGTPRGAGIAHTQTWAHTVSLIRSELIGRNVSTATRERTRRAPHDGESATSVSHGAIRSRTAGTAPQADRTSKEPTA